MAFSKRIILITRTQGQGISGMTEKNRKTVWADVTDMGVTTKFAAEAAGYSAELQAVMYRSEYAGENYAEYGDDLYRIVNTGRTDNDLHIKLILSRG